MKKQLSLALVAALFALPLSAFAQDEAAEEASAEEASAEEASSNFSWNLSATTAYMFRGVDLTDDEGAIQGGLDYALPGGFYVGTWSSNVNFVDGDAGQPDIEIDGYIGWNHDINDDWNFDFAAMRYFYIGERSDYGNIDYNEYFNKLSYKGMVTFTFAYANNYGQTGGAGYYYNVAGSQSFGDFTFDAGVGLSTWGNKVGLKNYVDWSFGVSRAFGPVNASLMYTGTDSDGADNFGIVGDDTLTLTFRIEG